MACFQFESSKAVTTKENSWDIDTTKHFGLKILALDLVTIAWVDVRQGLCKARIGGIWDGEFDWIGGIRDGEFGWDRVVTSFGLVFLLTDLWDIEAGLEWGEEILTGLVWPGDIRSGLEERVGLWVLETRLE